MRILRLVSYFVAAIFIFAAPVRSQCNHANLPVRFTEVEASARDRATKVDLTSIAIAVARHGKIVCEEAFGWVDGAKKIPATPSSVYAAGSVAKALTGAAVYVLAGRGKLRLDAAPEQYGVRVRTYAGSGVTIRQLLSMTAGIQHGWFYDYDSSINENELLDRYAISAFPPGQQFIYSNFSFGILGEVVERTSGRPFPEFMREEVFKRLHMGSSGFDPAGLNAVTGNQAGKTAPRHTFHPVAGGGFYTSAHDLALFGLFQLDPTQKLIDAELMKEMHTLNTEQQIKSRYKNGWGLRDFKDGTSVLISDGRVLGGNATLVVLPKEGVVISCLTNATSEDMDELAFKFAAVFSDGLLDDLESSRKEARAASAPQPFHAEESQQGLWTGTVQTPKGEVSVRMLIAADDHVEFGVNQGAMVAVKDLGVERGFLTGEAAATIDLPETGNQPSDLQLQFLWTDGNHLVGTARAESTGDLPRFGLPLYVSLSMQR